MAQIAERIRAARGVLLTTHMNPDGDAIGSEMGLALGLQSLGKPLRVVNDSPAPEKYRFLDPESTIEVLRDKPAAGTYVGLDLGILLDTSEPSRTGRLEESFFSPGLERICIDHHPGPPNPRFLHHWVAPGAPATGSLVLRLLDALGVELDVSIGTALFVALATDTGWFRFANTTAEALKDAARLLATGVEPESLYARIYEDFSAARMVLLGQLLAGIRIEFAGRFVWSSLDRAALERAAVPFEELDGFAEALKSIHGAEVSAAVIEVSSGRFKVSLRSRGAVVVNTIAQAFEGGGHAKAAGFRAAGDLDGLMARLRARVAEALGSK